MKSLLLVVSLTVLSACVRADTVYLTNGNTLEGRVRYADGKIYLDQPAGTIILMADKVEHVEKSATVLDEYEAKLAALNQKKNATADDYAALGKFAADKGLKGYDALAYRKAITLDTNHAVARKALGYVLHDDMWMTPDEANLARGLVKHDGQWVTPEAREDLLVLKQKAEIEKAKVAAERLKMQRLEKQIEVLEAREAARQRYEQTVDERYPGYSPYGGVYYNRPQVLPTPTPGAGSPRPANPSATVPPPPSIGPISNSGLGTIK